MGCLICRVPFVRPRPRAGSDWLGTVPDHSCLQDTGDSGSVEWSALYLMARVRSPHLS
jgi:hypothetical protein